MFSVSNSKPVDLNMNNRQESGEHLVKVEALPNIQKMYKQSLTKENDND